MFFFMMMAMMTIIPRRLEIDKGGTYFISKKDFPPKDKDGTFH
jgi:hypothetical protein